MALGKYIAGRFLLHKTWNSLTVGFTQSQIKIYSQFRLSSTNPNESFIARGWRKLAVAVRTFMAGSKAVYNDVKRMYELRSKHGNYILVKTAPQEIAPGRTSFPLTRQQLHFTVNTQKTLVKMLPTVTLFFVPVLGYIVPLVAFMYPDKLLSNHFWTEDQVEAFRLLKAKQSEEVFKNLIEDMKENSPELVKFLDNLHSKVFSVRTDWRDQDSLASLQPTTNQLGLLCSGWGLRTWLPLRSRQQHLEKHMYYLFTCDWLAVLEGGVDKLTDKDVVEMCTERRIRYTKASSVDVLKQELKTWISLTTSFQECPVYLMANFPVIQYLRTN